ncbi:MAG: ATP cone domain-containing protein, partial [Carnobacterium sp.]
MIKNSTKYCDYSNKVTIYDATVLKRDGRETMFHEENIYRSLLKANTHLFNHSKNENNENLHEIVDQIKNQLIASNDKQLK